MVVSWGCTPLSISQEPGDAPTTPATITSQVRRGAGPSSLPAPPPGPSMETAEKECGALGGLFQAIVNDMKVTGADAARVRVPFGDAWRRVAASRRVGEAPRLCALV